MPTFRQATVPVLLCLSALSTLALADPGRDLSGTHPMKGQGNMPADPPYSGRCECLLFRRYPALVTPNLEKPPQLAVHPNAVSLQREGEPCNRRACCVEPWEEAIETWSRGDAHA